MIEELTKVYRDRNHFLREEKKAAKRGDYRTASDMNDIVWDITFQLFAREYNSSEREFLNHLMDISFFYLKKFLEKK